MTAGERRIATHIAVAAAVYILIGFLTGGHYVNHRYNDCTVQSNELDRVLCRSRNEDGAVASGIFWPVYWLSRFSLWATK